MPKPLRIGLILLPVILAAGFFGWFLLGKSNDVPAAKKPGRLVVFAVFDQMRGDYPERWAKLYGANGFERIKRDGLTYTNAHLPYSCTSTGPGHAAIGTGVTPSVNGIVENAWYDRDSKGEVLSIRGQKLYERVPELPPSVAPVKKADKSRDPGFGPDQLLVEGIGDHLKKLKPDSRVFGLALKDRSAAMMAGKHPDGAYCFDTLAGEFHTTSYYRDTPHDWVKAFNAAQVADKWFGKSWERLKPESVYDETVGPDDAPGESKFVKDKDTHQLTGYGPTFPHRMNPAEVTAPSLRYYERVEASPFGNELVWDFAKACIEAEKLGSEGRTDLLFLGFSSNDLVGHKWGPDSHEVLDITLRSDELLAKMIEYLEKTVGAGNYTLILSADHGICPLPEHELKAHPDAARFDPRVELDPEIMGKYLDEKFGPLGTKPTDWFLEKGKSYFPFIYLNRIGIKAHGADLDDVAETLAKWAGNRPHIQAAYPRSTMMAKQSSDPLLKKCQLGYVESRCGDIYLVHKPYCLLGSATTYTTGTSHGTPHDYDTHIPVMAYGANIPKLGGRTEPVNALIYSPILCHALGIDPPANLAETLPNGWK